MEYRSLEQIQANKGITLTLPQTGLVRYYNFNQGTGGGNNTGVTTLTDNTGNSSGGTLAGFTLTGIASNWIGNVPFNLPLQLTAFNASTSGAAVNTSWTTANEYKAEKFELERSADGSLFTIIATIPAKNDKANSYSWQDAHPGTGNNFYRLKMSDIDGTVTYSKVVTAIIESHAAGVKIYGAPGVTREISVQLSDKAPQGNYGISIFNITGALVNHQQWVHNGSAVTQQIQVPSSVVPGVYTIIVKNSEQQFTQRWIIQ